jgi:hypothetical protein
MKKGRSQSIHVDPYAAETKATQATKGKAGGGKSRYLRDPHADLSHSSQAEAAVRASSPQASDAEVNAKVQQIGKTKRAFHTHANQLAKDGTDVALGGAADVANVKIGEGSQNIDEGKKSAVSDTEEH